MGRKRRGRRKRKQQEIDPGSVSFRCRHCGHEFEMKWIDIFNLQEMTHGYVGFDIDQDFIGCPRCGENANVETDDLSPDGDETAPF